MPYYVGLFKFTDFGRQNIKSSPDRQAGYGPLHDG